MQKVSEQKLNISKLFCAEQPKQVQQKTQAPPDPHRFDKFMAILEEQLIDQQKLSELAWGGVSPSLRKTVWPILLNYVSNDKEAQSQILTVKRNQYQEMVDAYFHDSDRLDEQEKSVLLNVVNDVKAINNAFLRQQQKYVIVLVRVLFLWNIRNPQVYYYKQDFSNLIMPFFLAYMDVETENNITSEKELKLIEADMYWSFTLMLDPVKKYFQSTDGEGQGSTEISQEVLKILTQMNPELIKHWQVQGFEIAIVIQKWMQQLLISLFDWTHCSRVYDTFISEGQNYIKYIQFLICAILLKFSTHMLKLNKLQMYKYLLEGIETRKWNQAQIEILFAEAYSYKTLYQK